MVECNQTLLTISKMVEETTIYHYSRVLAKKKLKRGGGCIEIKACGFNTFFKLHEKLAIQSGMVHPSLTLWLDPCYSHGML